MKFKRGVRVLLLLCIVALGAGCVWLRLLSFKHQLADLDHTTRIADRNGLTVHFLKPVVYGEDLFAIGPRPSSIVTNQSLQTWSWTYHKVSRFTNAEPGDLDLKFQALIEGSKLSALRIPERMLTVLPKNLFLGLLRSIGRAEIDRKHDTLRVNWVEGGPHEKVEPLNKTQITSLLGIPFYSKETNGVYSCLYKYLFRGWDQAWARFTFATNSDKVATSEGCIGNIAWTLTAEPGKPGMKVTLALLPTPIHPPIVRLEPGLADDYVGHYQDAAGHVLTFGYDGNRFALAGSMSTDESANAGWWQIWPSSPGHFFTKTRQFVLAQNAQGKTDRLLIEERGFSVCYLKISNDAPRTPAQIPMESQTYDAYTGRYRVTSDRMKDAVYPITREGDQLLCLGIRIYPASQTNFFFKLVDSHLTFIKDANGQAARFILQYDGTQIEADRMRP